MRWRDDVDHLDSSARRDQVRSVVDVTAWCLGYLQAKWCVRPVNGVRVYLNIVGNLWSIWRDLVRKQLWLGKCVVIVSYRR